MNKLILRLTFVALVAQFGASRAATVQEDAKPGLPPIWGRARLKDSTPGAFRILSEIRLPGRAGSFVAEEWAEGPDQSYRLDVVSLETDKQTGRRTVLVNGGERHFYEPFKCRPLNSGAASSEELPAPLFKLFPSGHQFVVSGLGAIWLYALESGRVVHEPAGRLELGPPGGGDSKQRLSMRRALSGYEKFTVGATDKRFPYRIELYFESDGRRQLSGTIDPNTLALVRLVNEPGGQAVLSAKIIEIDTLVKASAEIAKLSGLFELPLGYGCVRTGHWNGSGAHSTADAPKGEPLVYAPPASCFESTEPDVDRPGARLCDIQVVASLPARQNDDLDKWKTHTSSLRLASGRLAKRAFLVQERRDFAPPGGDSTNSSTWSLLARKSLLRRTRRVWKLGDLEGEQSIYFELGDHARRCNSFQSAHLNEVPAFEVPLTLPAGELDEDAKGAGRRSDDRAHSTQMGGPSLGPKMMRELFTETAGFHPLREHLSSWLKYRDFTQEKRVESFELRASPSGRLIWSGPASIVRKFFLAASSNPHQTGQLSADSRDIHVDVYLFNRQLDRLLARLHLILAPVRSMDVAQLHGELGISACLLAYNNHDLASGPQPPPPPTSFLPSSTQRPKGSLNFVVTYPLDLDEQAAQLAMQMGPRIYGDFLQRLIKLSDNELDPLQVDNLQVDIEFDLIKLTGRLNKWPQLFGYRKTPGMRFGAATKRKLLLASEIKPGEPECADSCSHLGCSSFVYGSKTRLCDLIISKELDRDSDERPRLALEPDESCNLWTKRQPKEEPLEHSIPSQLFARMRRQILLAAGDGDTQNPLALELSLATGSADSVRALLLPNAISLDRDDRSGAANPLAASDPLDSSGDFVQAEYELLFQGRKLARAADDQQAFPVEEATHLSYEDCERLCRESDCKSFSHCQLEQTCLISQLDRAKSIEKNSEKDDFCYLMARMPASKFHKVSAIAPPDDDDDETHSKSGRRRRRQAPIIRRQHAGSSRDCAIDCLDSNSESAANYACKSFYFCASATYDCILMADRQGQVNEFAELGTGVGASPEANLCDLYQRSYLADYNVVRGKQFDPELGERQPGISISLLLGFDADSCASECTHADACLAFHVCAHGANELLGKHQIRCATLNMKPSGNATDLKLDLSSGSQLLKSAEMCTTFVARLTDSDEQSALKPAQGSQQTAGRADEESGSMGQVGVSSWTLGLLFVALGLVTGYGLTWLIALQNFRISTKVLSLRHRQANVNELGP